MTLCYMRLLYRFKSLARNELHKILSRYVYALNGEKSHTPKVRAYYSYAYSFLQLANGRHFCGKVLPKNITYKKLNLYMLAIPPPPHDVLCICVYGTKLLPSSVPSRVYFWRFYIPLKPRNIWFALFRRFTRLKPCKTFEWNINQPRFSISLSTKPTQRRNFKFNYSHFIRITKCKISNR